MSLKDWLLPVAAAAGRSQRYLALPSPARTCAAAASVSSGSPDTRPHSWPMRHLSSRGAGLLAVQVWSVSQCCPRRRARGEREFLVSCLYTYRCYN